MSGFSLLRHILLQESTRRGKEGTTLVYCCIRLKEHLDPGWQERLGGLQIVREPDGTSRLSGYLPDQPTLYGVLAKLSHLSLTLLSLECSDEAEHER